MRQRALTWSLACVLTVVVICLFITSVFKRGHLQPIPVTGGSTAPGPRQPDDVANRAAMLAVAGPQHLDRFAREVAPVVEAFLTRLGSLSQEGVLPPLRGPITTNRLTKLKFMGGDSNTVSTFILDGRQVFHYQAVHRNGMKRNGITSFWNVGKDESGMPLHLGVLTEDPKGNEHYVKMLTDTNRYPARSLEAVTRVALRVLAAIGPPDHARYTLRESWREAAGATALPFYTFIFPRQGKPSTDPSNAFRDEVMIRLKSTADGLVLDHYQDNSIVFAGSEMRE